MPIERDKLHEEAEDDFTIQLRPDTNAFEIMRYLAQYPETAFTPKEIHEATNIPRGSTGKTLSRLEDRDLVQHVGEYWAIGEDDRIASHIASMTSRESIANQYGDDWYGRNPDWADDLPDLGENA